MSLWTVRHLTVYRYSEPVEPGEHRMMFRPRESHDLRLLGSSLEITPRPASVRWLHDAFDNSVAVATFDGPTAELRFDSSVTLEHFEDPMPEYPLEEYARTWPFCYSHEELPNLAPALVNQYSKEGVFDWVSQFPEPSGVTGTMDLLRAMTLGIRRDFLYKRRTEKGVQSPGETLRRRSGSCRDFAVLMIEAARSIGLAARFVSGYIFVPGADSGITNGAGSTHAWMQVYLPGAGWIDFDPTNSIVGNRNLIRVAVAWDQRQVLPLWGTYAGEASSFLGMEVTVSVRETAQ
ncbi:MAG: transglutaminase family protein [Bryobacteraceae bacterium]|jgi:transglutaminase-like putative cysteine protease